MGGTIQYLHRLDAMRPDGRHVFPRRRTHDGSVFDLRDSRETLPGCCNDNVLFKAPHAIRLFVIW